MTLLPIELDRFGMRIYESKHREGDVVIAHSHAVHQILYVIDGKGSIRIGGIETEIAQDHLAYLVPFTEHAVVSDSRMTLLVLGFDSAAIRSELLQSFMRERLAASVCIQAIPPHVKAARNLLRQLLYEHASPDPLSGFARSVYVQELLLILARALASPPLQHANRIRAERIRDYIETSYYEPITADDIARMLGFSARYANGIFKEQFQSTPIQYLNEMRIKVAQRLLTESDRDIASICFEIGYDNLSTFYRTFKQHTGFSPHKYRQAAEASSTDASSDR